MKDCSRPEAVSGSHGPLVYDGIIRSDGRGAELVGRAEFLTGMLQDAARIQQAVTLSRAVLLSVLALEAVANHGNTGWPYRRTI